MTRILVDDTPMAHGRQAGGVVTALEGVQRGVTQALAEIATAVCDDLAAPAASDAAGVWSRICGDYVEQAVQLRDRGMLAHQNYGAAEDHSRRSLALRW